jgi:hypothetical protein
MEHDHPEGVLPELNEVDDALWSLRQYKYCLTDLDKLNLAMALAEKHAKRSQDLKWVLRYWGLELLRDCDNGEDL